MSNEIIPINIKDKKFEMLMEIYKEACNNLEKIMNSLKKETKEQYGYDMINTITSRIKTPQSILNKMKRKKYAFNYKNMIDSINDIAGVRVVCPLKSDIKKIKRLLEEMPDIDIIEEKDYLRKPKKSGYSGYHLIIEIPVNYKNHDIIVKVELQMRTMAMDFWATIEHKARYKSKHKVSFFDSKKLSLYAKILNLMDNKIVKIYQKQQKNLLKNM